MTALRRRYKPNEIGVRMNYLDFELEISEGAGREYPVAVLHSPAGEAREKMIFPYDTLALENRLKDLQIALLRSGGKTRKMPLPEEQAVQDFGRELFDALFVGEVRTRYDMSWREATQKDLGLRLKLRIQSPGLAALPWEFLYDSRQAEYVCLSRNTPIVRYLEIPQPIQPLTVAPPLRILGMAVSPNDAYLGKLDIAREKQRVENATKSLRERGVLELTWLEGQTWRDLHKAMRAGPWHIFHFIGHGGFDKQTDEGLIYLANDDGESERLPATSLGRLLSDHRSLRLVLLNACEGARGSDRDLFSSTAAILVRRGLPAVLAMQYSITDHAAIEFSRAFYEVLAEGMAVDTAVVEARKAVSFAVSNTIEWGTPVLYMRAPDGQIFNLHSFKTAAPPTPPAPPQIDLAEQRHLELANLQREAEAAVAREDWHAASEKYRLMLELQPDYAAALAGLKHTRQKQELPKLYNEAKHHIAAKRWSQAVAVLEKACSLSTNYKDVVQLLAASKKELVEETARAQVEAQRLELENLLREAEQAMARDELSVALHAYQRMLKIAPNNTVARAGMARYKNELDLLAFYLEAKSHEAGKRWSEALTNLQKVRALAPNYKDVAPLIANIEKNLAEENRREKVAGRLREAEDATKREDWSAAIHAIMELLALEPNHAAAKKILRSAQQEQELAALYVETQKLLRQRRWQQALASLQRIQNLRGNYKDVEEQINRARQELQKEQQAAQRQAEPPPIVRQPRTSEPERSGQNSFRTKRGLWLGVGITVLLIFIYIALQQREQLPESSQTPIEPSTQNMPKDSSAPAGMVLIPAGSFIMGSNEADDERPHQVSVSAFYLDKYEVTVGQYEKFLLANPSHDRPNEWTSQLQNANRPVVYVSWSDAVAYCNWLSQQRGKRVRLPTEAEWEYAARGGLSGKKYPWGDDLSAAKANYDSESNRSGGWENAKRYLKDVGSYTANNYGLHDMAGNVWEWCADWYGSDYYQSSPAQNPKGPTSGTYRVLRGGSWNYYPLNLRCAYRYNYEPALRVNDIGFRCAQDVR